MGSNSVTIAYLSDGKLFLKRGDPADAKAELVESPFAQQSLDRSQRSRQRSDWKVKGDGANFMAGQLLWGTRGSEAELRQIRMTGITAGANAGEIVYALDMHNVGGVFVYETATGYERRLFHRNEFKATDLRRHPTQERVAFSLRHPDGAGNIALLDLDKGARGIREVTEGDSLDEAPAWVPDGDGQQIVFQSAGIGRNTHGAAVALSSYAIQKVDLDTGKFETLAEDEAYDYLLPRPAADGSLYYIRRPYKPEGHVDVSPWKLGLDILLFPFRLARALAMFLNFFSMMWWQKPLLTAGGPKREGMGRRDLVMWGKRLDTERAMRELAKDKSASLVPGNWELIRRDKSGEEKAIASGVLGFDLGEEPGSVIYTNGTTVYHLDAAGQRTTLCNDSVIEHVAIVRA
jgi:dipeptidyl aminopeptidase/acylaminoacyl peptidase